MSITNHKVAGVYERRGDAEAAVRDLVEAGFAAEAVTLVTRENRDTAFADPDSVSEEAGKDVLAGAGTGAGAGAGVAALVAVIGAAPVLTVLAGAAVGALAGTAVAGVSSASVREPDFLALVREAVESDRFVVVVETRSESDVLRAQDRIAQTAAVESIDQSGAVHTENP